MLIQFYNFTETMKGFQLTLLTKYIQKIKGYSRLGAKQSQQFRPSTFLHHPFLQSVYNVIQPVQTFNMHRECIFFDDGGNVALDWSEKIDPSLNPPILFIMHGLTGGSDCNYIKVLMEQATKQQFQCVCLNSRGINTEMTSPIPFFGIEHTELKAGLDRVTTDYPNSPIYLLGASFGGNYLIRYLLKEERHPNIKALIALSPPLNVKKVIDDMETIYQRFFVRRYIYETVQKHPQMQHWQKIGLVDMKHVYKSQSLRQFHERMTIKLLGLNNVDQLFDLYNISDEMISSLNVNTYFMTSKDDPIVSYKSLPMESIQRNPSITIHTTQKGGHLCWFTGLVPKRWYPKPTMEYIKSLRKKQISQAHSTNEKS